MSCECPKLRTDDYCADHTNQKEVHVFCSYQFKYGDDGPFTQATELRAPLSAKMIKDSGMHKAIVLEVVDMDEITDARCSVDLIRKVGVLSVLSRHLPSA